MSVCLKSCREYAKKTVQRHPEATAKAMPYFDHDDITLYYETHGSGPPLLLVAGFASVGNRLPGPDFQATGPRGRHGKVPERHHDEFHQQIRRQ
jgi:hypothetical protein